MLTVSLVDIAKFGKNCKIWSKLPNLVELVKFGLNSEILLTFLNLVGLVCFSMALNPQPLINDQGRYRSGRVAKKKTYTNLLFFLSTCNRTNNMYASHTK